jgi:hypothetical protein
MPNSRLATQHALANIALATANEAYAAELWRDGQWDWYDALRRALVAELRASKSFTNLQLHHLRFLLFLNAHLVSGCDEPASQGFPTGPVPPEVLALCRPEIEFQIDNSPLFSSTT